MEHLTKETFKQKVFNYETNPNWKLGSDKPCIIDFYADWCQPCKIVAPILENLSKKYEGKINFYKVDTESEQELARIFNIRSIPTMLFCPVEGSPQVAVGALPENAIEEAITKVLFPKLPEVEIVETKTNKNNINESNVEDVTDFEEVDD